jgi:hypothetical protein
MNNETESIRINAYWLLQLLKAKFANNKSTYIGSLPFGALSVTSKHKVHGQVWKVMPKPITGARVADEKNFKEINPETLTVKELKAIWKYA